MREELKKRIGVARGSRADVLIKNAEVVDVFSLTTEKANVALNSQYIAGIGDVYDDGECTYDFSGMYLIPGLVDGHIHLESSFLSPRSFAHAVVPHGTTSCVVDPHEIANVAGLRGIDWLIESARGLPVDLFFMAPSCVPATHLETSGAKIGVDEVRQILGLERCLGLGEVMNFPGVLAGDDEILEKIELAYSAGKRIDGHAPGLSGPDLNAYLSVHIETDHECTTRHEAGEKLRKGMKVMIREGSLAKNLTTLLPLVNRENRSRFMLVSDDVNPENLATEGHMDRILRKTVKNGCEPIIAVALATTNTCVHYGLRDRGAITPGFLGDLVVVRDLDEFEVEAVFKGGGLVWSRDLEWARSTLLDPCELLRSVNVALPVDFALRGEGGRARVIELIPEQLLTRKRIRTVKKKGSEVVADPTEDILKLAVIERHRRTGSRGLGLVHGFGLRKGALASSVAHDSHNIIIVGTNDEDMSCALERIVKMGGGLVAAAGQKVVAELALPIGGLLSDESVQEVTRGMNRLHSAARELGCRLKDPFTTLSFLALPVIPELRLSDLGLVDVSSFQLTSLWED